MGKMMGLVRTGAVGAGLLVLGACSATFQNHGYVPAPDELAKIKIGEPQAQVVQEIGTPSTDGLIKPPAWYYVQSRWRTFGPFKPKEIKREVVAITFDKQGNVANIQRFGLNKGHVVTLSTRVTQGSVQQLGILQQLFSDVGRVNAAQMLNQNQFGH